MRNLFFFGTLRHIPLLEIVLGRGGDELVLLPAVLPGYRVSSVAEGPFPYIAAEPGAQAEGLLVSGLSDADVARLNFYEGSFAYDLVAVTLEGGQRAEVYVPQPEQWTAQGDWSLAQWEADWGEMSCHAAHEVMGYYGKKTQSEVVASFDMIRKRAASKVRAASSLHGARTMQGSAEVIFKSTPYINFFALNDLVVRHDHFEGTTSEPLERAVFLAPDAAILLPYDPVRDRVLLVEQIRMGPLVRCDPSPWQLEPIAGQIDVGETPLQAALREAREEAGIEIKKTEKLAEVYASPGTSTEFYYIYLGLTDLPDDIIGPGGLDSEGEDIRSHLLPFDELMAYVDNFSFANSPLVLSALWLARHRERLRSG